MRRRHDSLIPFAHDHHSTLVIAIGLKKAEGRDVPAKRAALTALLGEWRERLERHFLDEERFLEPLLTAAERSRLTGDHETLRRCIGSAGPQSSLDAPAAGFCGEVGRQLEQHIRWEDRQLFDAIEARATQVQLETLARQTSRVR